MTSYTTPFVPTAGILLSVSCLFEIYATHVGRKRGIKLTSATVRPGAATQISSWSELLLSYQTHFPVFFFCVLTLTFSESLASTRLGAAFCAGVAIYLGLRVLTRTTMLERPRPLFAIDTLLILAAGLCYAF